MGFPEEDLPQFPVSWANSLAAELDRLAGRLEAMIEARVQAGTNLPEFQGNVADQFRDDLDAHASYVAGVVENFRTTAGRLRDAVEDHQEDRSRMIAMGMGNVA